MTDHLLHRNVSGLFPPSKRGEDRSRVGVEQELLTRDACDGSAVADRAGTRAVAGAPYERWVGFEPGGQLELSLPCAPLPTTWPRCWDADDRLAARGLRSRRHRCSTPLRSTPLAGGSRCSSPAARYVGMERHFDRIGPAGRRMMRQTASTQVCLDWWPGEAGREQWRLALLAGPFLAATFARSSGPGSRLATWLAVDPARTAYDDRLLRGDDPVAAYADFAADAAVFGLPGGDPTEPTSFATWARAHELDDPVVAHHLSTLFPPVRPRGRYLEVRFLDVQPDDLVAPVVAAPQPTAVRRRHPPPGPPAGAVRRPAVRRPLGAGCARHPDRLLDRGTALLRLRRRAPPGPAPTLVGAAGHPMSALFVVDPLDGLDAGIDSNVGLMAADERRGRAGVGVRARGPRPGRRTAGRPRAADRAASADRRAATTAGWSSRRGSTRSSSACSTWPTRWRWCCCGSTRRWTRATCARRTCSTSPPTRACRWSTGPAGVRELQEKLLGAAASPTCARRRW